MPADSTFHTLFPRGSGALSVKEEESKRVCWSLVTLSKEDTNLEGEAMWCEAGVLGES